MNFLPEENQIVFKKKYKQKFFTLLGCVIMFLLVINLILVLSYYFSLRIKNNIFKTQISFLNNSSIFKKSFDASLKFEKLDSQTKFLEKQLNENKRIFPILEKILSFKEKTITVEFISFNKKVGETDFSKDSFILKGKAETRESFLDFIRNLEKEKDLFEIRSDPNNLLKEKDFDYSLQIFIK